MNPTPLWLPDDVTARVAELCVAITRLRESHDSTRWQNAEKRRMFDRTLDRTFDAFPSIERSMEERKEAKLDGMFDRTFDGNFERSIEPSMEPSMSFVPRATDVQLLTCSSHLVRHTLILIIEPLSQTYRASQARTILPCQTVQATRPRAWFARHN